MSAELLPHNATPLERRLADTLAHVEREEDNLEPLPEDKRLPGLDLEPVSGLWNPVSDFPNLLRTCPAELLPWLAWAEQVPEWSSDPEQMDEDTQRQVIATARETRHRRGTAQAMIKALEALNYGVELKEWFQQSPTGTPYTFSLKLELTDKGLTAEQQERLQADVARVVDKTKNVRSHLDVFNIILTQHGSIKYSAIHQSGDATTIYPFAVTELEQSGPVSHGWAAYDVETTTIYPQ